ncbi:MAG: ABC transporter ATP-binding protein [Candidatus Bathyarchaeota archaeon]|nr:ABC transporter ATP-binding protein [Candidatus Bathyarchaeota archaeon]
MPENIIQAHGLTKTYQIKNGAKINAVDNVDLEVPEGQFLAVVGASGSGKTTLLNLLGGLDKPTKGKVVVAGTEVSALGESELTRFRRRMVGFVFQAFNLIGTLTASENVQAALAPTGTPAKQQAQRAQELLELVGLQRQSTQLPVQLSAGEQQRVAIARALANNPKILLLDEPTGNLDTQTGKQIMQLCQQTSKQHGQTIIAATHAEYITKHADQTLHMKDGKLTNT